MTDSHGDGQWADRLRAWGPTAGSVVAAIFAWQAVSLAFEPRQFPGIVRLAGDVGTVLGGTGRFDPLVHYGMTAVRVAIGFTLSMGFATLWGVAMGVQSTAADYLVGPLFVLLTVPSVVWAFLGVLWLGLTELAVPVLVIVFIVFPYLTVTIWEGTRDLDESLVEMSAAYGASTRQRWRAVYLPHLRPVLFGAARVGLAVAWKLALVAEVFGAATGVGVVVNYHFEAFDTGMVLAWAAPAMALIYGTDRLLVRAKRRTARWHDNADGMAVIE